MNPSLSWFERDQLAVLLRGVGATALGPDPSPAMTLPHQRLQNLDPDIAEASTHNRFARLAHPSAGRFAASVSTQPGPHPPLPHPPLPHPPGPRPPEAQLPEGGEPASEATELDKKATRLAGGVSPPEPARRPSTDLPKSEWGGSAAVHREQAVSTDPLSPPPVQMKPVERRPRRGEKGRTITAPPSSSDPLSSDFPVDSSDLASSRPEHISPFVAPLGPMELRLNALLQWCLGQGMAAGAAVADHDGLPIAVKTVHEVARPHEPWLGGALEAALVHLEADGPIREGRMLLHRAAGPLLLVWVPAVLGRRWYLLLWGAEVPPPPLQEAMVDAFRELCRRARQEVAT